MVLLNMRLAIKSLLQYLHYLVKKTFVEIIITDLFAKRGLEKKLLKKIIETSKKLNASIIYMVSDKEY